MSEPILIHIDGHTYSNHIPLDFSTDDIKAVRSIGSNIV